MNNPSLVTHSIVKTLNKFLEKHFEKALFFVFFFSNEPYTNSDSLEQMVHTAKKY